MFKDRGATLKYSQYSLNYNQMKNSINFKISSVFLSVRLISFLLLTLISSSSLSQTCENLDKDSKADSLFQQNKTSLFDYIYQMEGIPKIKIETNVNNLINKKIKEEYQETTFQLFNEERNEILDLQGRIRARGNIRKKVCYFPPVKIDFSKSTLDSLGFLKLDKLKFVFPADPKKYSQERLLKEFFLYELYAFLDSSSIRTKLVDITIIHNGKEKYHFTGFLIEDEEEYARRNKAIMVEKGKLRASVLDRQSFLKMVFFQYMIANTDYSVSNRHNLEMVKLPHIKKVVAVPYDFDYSGFVGQKYAMPYTYFPIESVHERYLFPSYRITEGEYNFMVQYFLSIEKEVYELCESATYMKSDVIKDNKAYLKSFFKLLRKPKRLKEDLVSRDN